MFWILLGNSLCVGGMTVLGSLGLGLVGALGLALLPPRGRMGCAALALFNLALPSFLVVNTWLEWFGAQGPWRDWLPLNLFSIQGTAALLVFLHWPIVLWLVWSAWSRLDATVLEQDPALTGWALIRWVLLPMARQATILAASIILVLALNQFAVPAILQTKVLPAAVWVQFNAHFDSVEALRLAWPLMIGPALLLGLWRGAPIPWPLIERAYPAAKLRQRLGRAWTTLALAGLGLGLLLGAVLPLAQLALSPGTWAELGPVMRTVGGPMWQSCAFAALTATAALAVALVTWRFSWAAALWLAFLMPGTMLGIGLILALNRAPFTFVYQSAAVIVVAWTLRFLAPCWHGVRQAMRHMDSDLADEARLDGASRWAVLRHVQWPQIRWPAAVAWYLVYLLCLWDVETLVLVVPPGRETLALRIFNLLHYGHNAQVNALCLVLLGLAAAPLLAGWIIARLRR